MPRRKRWWRIRRETPTDTHTERVRNVRQRGAWPKMHIERSVTTVFVVTALHPKDGHEFGVAASMKGSCDELSDDKLGAVMRAMSNYIKTHP